MSSSTIIDCPICMDAILDSCKDCCTTPCGHMFHSSCIFKSFSNSFSCPMCRNELIESSSVDSESLYSDEESEDEEEEDEEEKPRFTLKQIHEVLKKRGFGEEDLLAIILQNSEVDLIATTEAIEKKSEDLLDILYDIYDSAISVDYRDSRTYAQVLQGNKRTDEAGAGPQSSGNQSENQGFPNLSLSENQGFPNLSLKKIEMNKVDNLKKLKVE